jgi:DNA-binding LytR/AlgR family response regulator
VLRAGDPEITVMAKSVLQVPVRTISAAVASGRGVDIQLTNSQSLKTSETFRIISEKLEPFPNFLLINRGVIVNMDHVLAPEGDCMKMKDGTLHPVKVNGRGAVMKEFTQYMISRVERWS